MSIEYVYKGHNNTIDKILKADGTAQDLIGVTQVTITIGDFDTLSSVDKAAGVITWDQDGYDTGEIRIDLGAVAALTGSTEVLKAVVVVYDPSNTDGIRWGSFKIKITTDEETS